jgi:hypothetical protein
MKQTHLSISEYKTLIPKIAQIRSEILAAIGLSKGDYSTIYTEKRKFGARTKLYWLYGNIKPLAQRVKDMYPTTFVKKINNVKYSICVEIISTSGYRGSDSLSIKFTSIK